MNRRHFIALSAAGLTAGCSPQKADEPLIYTGKTLNKSDMVRIANSMYLGKSAYAEVNENWLDWAYSDFRDWLNKGPFGIPSWTERSQCTLFCSAFEVYCQTRFFAHAFKSNLAAQGIGVGTAWYLLDSQKSIIDGHAVNVVVTPNGARYFDPQIGKTVNLSKLQKDSIYFLKFD